MRKKNKKKERKRDREKEREKVKKLRAWMTSGALRVRVYRVLPIERHDRICEVIIID